MPAAKHTILILEDDGVLQRGLREFLELEGYHTVTTNKGRVAQAVLGLSVANGDAKELEGITSQKIDLAILDNDVVGPQGIGIMRQMRHSVAHAETPIIFASGMIWGDLSLSGIPEEKQSRITRVKKP